MSAVVAAVEAGGTKFRAAVYPAASAFAGPDAPIPIDEIRLPTTGPAETLNAVADFLSVHPIDALGVASFGPIVVDPQSDDYGTLAPTPKPGWSGVPILRELHGRLDVDADILTDVEAAALAEHRYGAGAGCDSVAYVTVGTGVGVGVASGVGFNGSSVYRGRDHIELGHIALQRHPDDEFEGNCPFHDDCLEGLAAGPAVKARCGSPAEHLGDDHPVWAIVADYLAQLACVITWAFSPDRILFSGGVGARAHLAARIQAATARRLAGYSVSHAGNERLVATAGLGNDAGLVGAYLLAASLLPSE